MAPTQIHHLIDTRSPAEFTSTSASESPLPGAINVEYTRIAELGRLVPGGVARDDRITVYCRSGRRSAMARAVLLELGFGDVRDLGGLEAARVAWGGGKEERKEEGQGCAGGCGHGKVQDQGQVFVVGVNDPESLRRSHEVLLEGLRAAD